MKPLPVCYICGDSVPLEDCKTDENGNAVHEKCYLVRVKLMRESHGRANDSTRDEPPTPEGLRTSERRE